MRKFSVKHLLGMSASPTAMAAAAAADEEEKKKSAATEADDDSEDDAKKSKSKSKSKGSEDDDAEDADDGEEDDGETDDSDDEKAKASRAARQQERTRCATIITSAEADGRLALACHFAFNTGLSAKAAIASLTAAPKTQVAATTGLAAAMAAQGNPNIGSDGKGADAPTDHGWGTAVAKAENLTGRKPAK